MTSLGYARQGVTVTADDDQAKVALKEGGWEAVKSTGKTTRAAKKAADDKGNGKARLTEVPEGKDAETPE